MIRFPLFKKKKKKYSVVWNFKEYIRVRVRVRVRAERIQLWWTLSLKAGTDLH